MAGFAVESFLIGRISDKYPNPVKLFAYIEIIIGLYAFGHAPHVLTVTSALWSPA